jgi:hypothetical protein
MYRRAFQVCILDSPYKKPASSFDFVEQILYRLAKGRHFTFLEEGKSGMEIAQSLYLGIKDKIIDHCRSSENISNLCSWAATMARINRFDDAKILCERLFSLTTSDLLLNGKDFVNFARTQRVLLSFITTTKQDTQSDIAIGGQSFSAHLFICKWWANDKAVCLHG